MQQRGALGRAGRAAGILQHGDIVPATLSRLAVSCLRREQSREKAMALSGESGTAFFTWRETKLTKRPFEAEQIARRHQDDPLQGHRVGTAATVAREILQHEQKARRESTI